MCWIEADKLISPLFSFLPRAAFGIGRSVSRRQQTGAVCEFLPADVACELCLQASMQHE